MAFTPDFIKIKQSEEVQIPMGGDFVPSGLILPIKAAIRYSFYSSVDLKLEDFDFDGRHQFQGGGYRYYYNNQADAERGGKKCGIPFNPQRVISVQGLGGENLLNVDPKYHEKFGDVVHYDVSLNTLQSRKYRHEFHMLWAPSVVGSLAKAYNFDVSYDAADALSDLTMAAARVAALSDEFEQNPETYSELYANRDPDSIVFDDAMHYRMIGHPDSKADDTDYYTNSVLWKVREKLWKELGEPDSRRYLPIGLGKGTAYEKAVVTSKKLSDLLQFINNDWLEPVWVRLLNVPDPRADACYISKTTGETKRPTVPVIGEFFSDRASAFTAAQVDLARKTPATDKTGETGAPAVPALSIPEAYAKYPDTWKDTVRSAKAEVGSGPPPLVLPKLVEYVKSHGDVNFGATADDLYSWFGQV